MPRKRTEGVEFLLRADWSISCLHLPGQPGCVVQGVNLVGGFDFMGCLLSLLSFGGVVW